VARQQRRRANGEGSVFYDSVKGTWVGQIELPADASGRRVRRKFHAPTAAEARAKLNKLQAAQAAGQDLSQHTAESPVSVCGGWPGAGWQGWRPSLGTRRDS
jgi:hypothetical protein